jgi:multicomponent Na+:H+ antiporter subunit B
VKSTILSTASRVLMPLLIVLSIYVLWRGHNEPGGGFIGGLLAVIAVALFTIAHGAESALKLLRVDPLSLAGIGLACAVVSGLWGVAAEGVFLKGVWPFYEYVPGKGTQGLPVGSILLFDTGVYLTVLGAVSAILFALEEAVYPAPDDDAEAD